VEVRCRAGDSVGVFAGAAGFRQWFTLDFGREEEIARAASLHGNAAVLVGSLRLIDNELNEFGVFKRRCGALVLEPLTGARDGKRCRGACTFCRQVVLQGRS